MKFEFNTNVRAKLVQFDVGAQTLIFLAGSADWAGPEARWTRPELGGAPEKLIQFKSLIQYKSNSSLLPFPITQSREPTWERNHDNTTTTH